MRNLLEKHLVLPQLLYDYKNSKQWLKFFNYKAHEYHKLLQNKKSNCFNK